MLAVARKMTWRRATERRGGMRHRPTMVPLFTGCWCCSDGNGVNWKLQPTKKKRVRWLRMCGYPCIQPVGRLSQEVTVCGHATLWNTACFLRPIVTQQRKTAKANSSKQNFLTELDSKGVIFYADTHLDAHKSMTNNCLLSHWAAWKYVRPIDWLSYGKLLHLYELCD